MGTISTIGVVIRPGVAAATQLAGELWRWCRERSIAILFESESGALIGQQIPGTESCTGCTAQELVERCDLIVTLGGDGTLIGVAHFVAGPKPVILGVNFGTLGFLTEIPPAQLFPTIEDVIAGRARIARRSMLVVESFRNGSRHFASHAINDAVVQKGARSRLLDLDLFVDSDPIMRLRGDGVIVATPTGSTAYSLAAGGSIVYPELDVMLVTPLSAHSLTSRPLILRMGSELFIDVPAYDGKLFLTLDGQISIELEPGDRVRVTEARHHVHLVRSASLSYFDVLRKKLNWGIPNQGD